MIDLGLAKRFKDPKTGQHIKFKQNRSMVGTIRYASINSHEGFETSRRDDLEAIGYVLVFLFKGKLPWQGVKAKKHKEKRMKIKEIKIESTKDGLCSDMPEEFQTYFNYVTSLQFDEDPDYDYIRKLFKEVFHRMGFEYDHNFEWTKTKKKPKVEDL